MTIARASSRAATSLSIVIGRSQLERPRGGADDLIEAAAVRGVP
jgi:hypothetical protein